MPGFGSGSFGSGGFGEWMWSHFAIVEALPGIYKDQDADVGDGRLRAMMEALTPSLDHLRLKIRDMGDLRDPLISPSDRTFEEEILILHVDDVGDGTSRVFISVGPDGDKYDRIRVGHVITDSIGNGFTVSGTRASALVTEVPFAPVDPETGSPSGKHVIVDNISFGNTVVVPLVSGTNITNENPTPSPVDNGVNKGPYVFTAASLPMAKNRVTLSWSVGGIPKGGYFTNTGARAGELDVGSSINFSTGVITVAVGGQVIDADSIRVNYTNATVTNTTTISSQHILAFLANDYGIEIDRHDPEKLQRAYVYHAGQLWDLKGTFDGYFYMGKIAGYIVIASPLYRIDPGFVGGLPSFRVYEYPSGSGQFYTDIHPERVLFDDVAADAIPTDFLCSDDLFPTVSQSVDITSVKVIRAEGTQTRYLVTLDTSAYSSMHESFGTHGHLTDSSANDFAAEAFTRVSDTVYTVEVVSIITPSTGAATMDWRVLKATADPFDFTVTAPDITVIGAQYGEYDGIRYKIQATFSDQVPINQTTNWKFIDSDGVSSWLESIVNVSGNTYQFEIVSSTAPALGPANLYYSCDLVPDCSYCRASLLRVVVAPGEILATPSALAEDALGRLITRLKQMVPAHVRFAEFAFTPGPVVASFSINISAASPDGWIDEAPFSAYYDYSEYPADDFAEDTEGIVASAGPITITNLNVFEEFCVQNPFVFTGWTGTGLWHVTQYRSSTQPMCFNYGQGDVGVAGQPGSVAPNYNTGSATTGTLTSPVIPAIAAATSVTLRFRHYALIEGGISRDLPSVVVRQNGGGTLVTIDKTELGLNTTGTTGGQFVTFSKNITSSVVGQGALRIDFVFDSVDAVNNTTEGWYIDDIEIQVVP